ncbi:hypothetical protein GDO81_010313 [Engystomops pustulosus]|uniref:Putative zinc-finger domain-containing protein n=1 Tax=Engystomops pustulosus TaxID=76066 RepID=A0AAV7BYR4_ENGPU|nr:hypothetical protein GDO81_010313 [Engystomops pustulosus]
MRAMTARRCASPREEGELEDGEISDDSVRPDSPKPVRHRVSSRGHPHQYHPRPSRTLLPTPHTYRPKEQYRLPPRIPPPPPMGDMGSRPSFWERSHDTLGRFRSRGRGGRFWDREWVDRGQKPGGQRPSNCGWRDPSPRKLKGRSPPRKPAHSVEESFEELLLKYKQIKLELESINKDEKLALKEDPVKEVAIVVGTATEPPLPEEKTVVEEAHPPVVAEKPPVKTFQAFELKPLRQKLKPIPDQKKQSHLEETKTNESVHEEKPVQNSEIVKEPDKTEENVPSESNIAEVVVKPAIEEEELSELHLRLLALQSASKKWQQKEQLVMKESKEKLSKGKLESPKDGLKSESPKEKTNANAAVTRKVNNTTTAAKQARRRQQTKAWKKLQQMKAEEKRKEEEEKKKQAEEDERRKREEEIRKIRDLSNQEEQYNRFMKLVGDRSKRSKSFDAEQKRAEKQSLENSGGIYQYDNYEEVAMDTDSETNSPGASPSRPFPGNTVGCVPSVLCVTEQFPSVWPVRCEASMYDPIISKSSPDVPLVPPPLPPEEPEQPPKPPFADEEEEEEMLLREELLKSLANKRATKSEEQTTNSQPSSPPLANIMPVPRITLTSANVNSAAHRKTTTQIVRVLRPIRRVIKLPKHKSVVVTLNASDDSESDPEPSSPGGGVFGGLESMIKEARRTAEASKPKASPKSEKENDPMRTPEALPDEKKIEYRLLKEEIASREKQKLLKTDQSKSGVSPTNSDLEGDGSRRLTKNPKVTEAESRHLKQKMLLLKDESLLKHLLQQEEKKRESIKTAELKITRLAEQLQATEKFLNANRALLKKLQEQIMKVQNRVEEKRTLSLKFGEELARAKAVASKELGKRKLDSSNMAANKMFKSDTGLVGSPNRQSAEAIAREKKRLQELEQEYALKIQKLKEMQARKIKEQTVFNPPVVEEPAEFTLPQPSLHDLSQDKITLDSEENEPDDEDLSTSVKERRRSFRDSNSFTKPNLKHADLTPYKEISSTPSKMATEGQELILGLNIDEVRRLHSSSSNLSQLLSVGDTLLVSSDKLSSGKEIPVDVDLFTLQTKQTDAKPFPFGPYRSPLLVFKSYRFSPYFRTKEKLLLSTVSHSNMIEPKTFFCRFDLTGTCNDDDCQWQHMRDCTLSRKQLFQDILSYNLDLIGCSENSTDEEIVAAAEKYVDKLFGVKRDHMSMDLMSVLLVSHVNESRHHTPPHTTYKEKRKWKPMYWKKPLLDSGSSDEDDSSKAVSNARVPDSKTKVQDAVVTSDDVRYFTNETDDISNLEASVLENPQDIQLWIKLAYKCLNQNEGTSSECLDSALNVLSRALEHNRDNPEIWSHYLKLFSQRGSREEVQEMCETAVEYAPSYQTWWTFLTLENSFEGKDQVCARTLQYLIQQVEAGKNSELLSLQCLEVLLYRVHGNLFTGRLQNALAILQNALKSPCEKSTADHLTPKDRCLAWLSYIHLMEFNSLPANFYDPTVANPSRIVNKEPFLIPWLNPQSVTTDPVMLLALFEAAVFSCSDENLNAEERIQVCLPLYKNMISLHLMHDRYFAAVNLCKQLLVNSSSNCDLLEALCFVYMKKGELENAMDVWISAFRNNPGNAQIFYNVCKLLVQQGRADCLSTLMEEFITSFYENSDEKYTSTDLIRFLLNFSVPLDFIAPALKNKPLDISDMQRPYLWLVFCLWQSLHATREEAVDAYEAALGAVMIQQDVLQRLWLDYLVFTNSKITGSRNKLQDSKHFADLVNRCLLTVPTRQPTPCSTAEYWTSYEFHNSVIFFYLSCAPKGQHSKILDRFSSMMPMNLGLALRVLKQEMDDNNIQIVKMQSKMLTYNFPMCLSAWKIAIAVETFLKGHKEVQHLYQRALQKLPLCAELWKDVMFSLCSISLRGL